MIVSFHWDLREHLHELRKDDKNPKLRRDARLYILTYLAMRANIRLRCWPSTKSICKETGYSQPMVVEARNWLIAHKAVVAVPFDKRIGEEEQLPVRQTVYQLTGILDLACGVVPYLAMSPDAITSVIAELEAIGGEVVAIKTSLAKTLVAKPKGIESSKGMEEKDTAPIGTAAKPEKKKAAPDQWDATIASVWKNSASGFVTMVKGMMFGHGKKNTTWADCNFDPPVQDTAEILAFGDYARLKMRRENITVMPTRPETIQRWFYEFRNKAKPAPVILSLEPPSDADAPSSADFRVYDPVTGQFLGMGAEGLKRKAELEAARQPQEVA